MLWLAKTGRGQQERTAAFQFSTTDRITLCYCSGGHRKSSVSCSVRLPSSSLIYVWCLWKIGCAPQKQKMVMLLVQSNSCPFWAEYLSTLMCQSAIRPLQTVVFCFSTFIFLHCMEQVINLFFTETFLEFICATVGVKCYMGGRFPPASMPPSLLFLSQCRYKWRMIFISKRTKGDTRVHSL